jgi:hypothetical protein
MTTEEIGILAGIGIGVGNLLLITISLAQAHNQIKQQKQLLIEALKREDQLRKELDKKDRLTFLTQAILDQNIPFESRQPFYDEYIKSGGNSTVVKFWFKEKELQLKLNRSNHQEQ